MNVDEETSRFVDQSIKLAQREWEATVDSLDEIILILGPGGEVARGNRTVEDWNLGKVKEISGLHFHQLFHPVCSDPACYMKTIWLRAQERLSQNESFHVEEKDDILNRYLSIRIRPVQPQKDGPAGGANARAVAVFLDITRSRLVLERIKHAASEMKSIFNAIPDSYIRLDSDGIIRAYKSGNFPENFFINSQCIGKRIADLLPSSFKEDYLRAIDTVIERQELAVVEYSHPTSEGEQIFEARFLPLHDRQVDIILRNITENKRLITIAETMNLMENLGYIFSGIRHEIGNPINAIKMTVSVLKNNLDGFSRERVMEYMDRVLSEINRVEYLLKNLKSFNMFEELNMMDIRLPEFMDKFLGLVRNDFERKGAKIEYYMHPDVETACGDARALHQVLLNILSNAADALAGIENPLISISVVKVGESVRVTVSDNGPGIPEVHRNDVFKPFFTTKSTGTGLGLNIVQKIITRMGGTVKIAGRRDLGTAVVITIPGGGRDCG